MKLSWKRVFWQLIPIWLGLRFIFYSVLCGQLWKSKGLMTHCQGCKTFEDMETIILPLTTFIRESFTALFLRSVMRVQPIIQHCNDITSSWGKMRVWAHIREDCWPIVNCDHSQVSRVKKGLESGPYRVDLQESHRNMEIREHNEPKSQKQY